MKEFDLVTCKKCKWVHFSISMEFAKSETDKFINFYNTLDDEGKSHYGDTTYKTLMHQYTHCMFCNSPHTNFRDYDETIDNNIDGHTINPIVHYEE